MNEENQIEEKNCKECLHFEACCKWTDFPKQIGFPICRKFTPTNTNLHQPCESVQVEEMAEYIFGNAITHDTQFKEDCRSIAIDLYNAGYRKQEWISVDERLPEGFETVLVFCDTGVRKFQCVSEMIEPNGKRWSAVCGFRVTHWMPLPEAPKMKGGAE